MPATRNRIGETALVVRDKLGIGERSVSRFLHSGPVVAVSISVF